MNNEELKLLTDISNGLNGLKDELKEIRNDVNELKDELKEVRNDVNELKDELKEVRNDVNELKDQVGKIDVRLMSVEIVLENEVDKSIKLLAEAHTGLVEKVDNIAIDVEETKETVSILKFLQHATHKNNEK